MIKKACPIEVIGECMFNECAWWNEKEHECCIKTIAIESMTTNMRIMNLMEMLARR